MGFIELERRLKLLRGGLMVQYAEEILRKDAPILLQLQKDQLLAGQKQDGKSIPSYYQDPFFSSPIKAARYAMFKDKLVFNQVYNIFGTKEMETPNLIIKGNLVHDRLFIEIGGGKLIIDANSPIRNKLIQKYNDLFGLNQTALNYYLNNFFIDEYRQKIENFLAQ